MIIWLFDVQAGLGLGALGSIGIFAGDGCSSVGGGERI
jgi:hypothetical protein